jgi:hypothetical protein
MSRAPVTKHSKYDESEPLKCFYYFIANKTVSGFEQQKYHNLWACPLHTNNRRIILSTNQAHKQI